MNCRQNRKLRVKIPEGKIPKQRMEHQTSRYRFIGPYAQGKLYGNMRPEQAKPNP
jgi:hypothetical protein